MAYFLGFLARVFGCLGLILCALGALYFYRYYTYGDQADKYFVVITLVAAVVFLATGVWSYDAGSKAALRRRLRKLRS